MAALGKADTAPRSGISPGRCTRLLFRIAKGHRHLLVLCCNSGIFTFGRACPRVYCADVSDLPCFQERAHG